jgi:hypothetical protein
MARKSAAIRSEITEDIPDCSAHCSVVDMAGNSSAIKSDDLILG